MLTLEEKLVAQCGNKFKRRGPIQNFMVAPVQTEIPKVFYKKFKNIQKHEKYSL